MAEDGPFEEDIFASPPRRIGDLALAFAAAFVLHAAILLPLLMQTEKSRHVVPGAAAVMVNIIRADGTRQAARAEPVSPAQTKATPPALEKPVERPLHKSTPMPRKKHAPVAEAAAPASSASSSPAPEMPARPQGVAVSGASETGTGETTAKVEYRDRLNAWLAAHKRYPLAARQMRIEGVVTLRFTVARDGSVLSHGIEKSSGSEILDREVEDMLERSTPLPAFPPDIKEASLDVEMAIGFRLDQ